MKFSLRKAIVLGLTVTMFAGAPLFVYSESDASGNSGSGTVSGINAPASSGGGGSSYVAPPPAPQNNALGGAKSSTRGAYDAWSVPGITAEVTAAGVDSNKIFVRTWDVTEKGSPAAMASLKAAAASVGATMGPTVEIDVRTKEGGKESELTGGTSTLRIGIPKNFQKEGATYGVARVVSGGSFTVLSGEVSGNVIKFQAPTGNAAYALLRYDN